MNKVLTYMRVLGCSLIVSAHFAMVYINVMTGTIIHLIADFICIPYFIKFKIWDMVIMLSFLIVIGVSKLWSQILTSSF